MLPSSLVVAAHERSLMHLHALKDTCRVVEGLSWERVVVRAALAEVKNFDRFSLFQSAGDQPVRRGSDCFALKLKLFTLHWDLDAPAQTFVRKNKRSSRIGDHYRLYRSMKPLTC